MADPPLILVVDDEQSYRDALAVALQREGFLVDTAADGPEALARFDASRPALVLLDVMLPKISGIDVCRELRTRSRVPIIMVTAKTSEIDAVVGLEVGADDYVTKPFRLRELIARVRVALRRVPLADEDGEHMEVIELGDVRLDAGRHEVYVRGAPVALPLKEFELLELLMANAGRVFDARRPHRSRVGPELFRRYEDARRAHQAAAVEDRGRSREPEPHRHRAGRRLSLRTGGRRRVVRRAVRSSSELAPRERWRSQVTRRRHAPMTPRNSRCPRARRKSPRSRRGRRPRSCPASRSSTCRSPRRW